VALLSQEGSTIESAVEIVRGGVSKAALFKNVFLNSAFVEPSLA